MCLPILEEQSNISEALRQVKKCKISKGKVWNWGHAGAGFRKKNSRSRSRPKTGRLRNPAYRYNNLAQLAECPYSPQKITPLWSSVKPLWSVSEFASYKLFPITVIREPYWVGSNGLPCCRALLLWPTMPATPSSPTRWRRATSGGCARPRTRPSR